MKAAEAAMTIIGTAIVIIVAIIVIPAMSGRVDISVAYAASTDTLERHDPSLLEHYKSIAITVNNTGDLAKLGNYIIHAKNLAGDNYGGGTRSFTVNGFEYYSLNSKLGGKLDEGGAIMSYDNDFYIILARKY